MNWMMVFIGGGIGSVGRYAIGLLLKQSSMSFPWSTLVANVLAAIVIGFLYFSGFKSRTDSSWLLLATGFCGGLSTFSAFSLETFEFLRDGNLPFAMLNIFLSLAMCLVIIFVMSKMVTVQG
jgi:fluoride exporter